MTMENEELKPQSLSEHLRELRTRLIQSLLALFVGALLCYSVSEIIFDIVRLPIQPYLPNGGLIFTGPADKFLAHLKLSFVCGVIISCPYWLFQIWSFVAPGLYVKEKKYTALFIGSGTGLFLLGVSFCYFGVLPMAFKFLMNYGGSEDKAFITIDQYLSFFTQMCLMFGLAFELPLIIVMLGILGMVSQKFLREKRRYAIMILSIISAIITPPDLYSMLLMLVPLVLLYELSIFLVGFVENKKLANEIE